MADVPTIMLAAGEASGDLHGATLCRALAAEAPQFRLLGMGGVRMNAAGMEIVADVTRSAGVGGTEAMGGLPGLWRAFRRLRRLLEGGTPPRALVLVDFPEFNLRLARIARRVGVPVVYFIPPQLWAWRPGRIRTLRRLVSLVLAVFPFEVPLYRRGRVPVAFVGHPLLDLVASAPSRLEARRALGIPGGAEVVGLLPGSRRQEITRILPVMREAVRRVAAARPGTRVLLALASTVEEGVVADLVGPGSGIEILRDRTHAVMRAADVLLATSGTATLEAALLGTPMIVCYKLSPFSEAVARRLLRVPWISLPNLTLGWAAVPELYGRTATPERLSQRALQLLTDGEAAAVQRTAFAELAGQLGTPGVCARAARLVLETIESAARAPAPVRARSGLEGP
jgi:lipid-A-disaccharide synthase